MLSYEYKDTRGLVVGDGWIEARLLDVGKTEQELIDFLGKDYAKANGAFVNFLDMLAIQMAYYKERS